ncbi:MAG: ATP-binding protein [Mycobacteriales bacterium]
MTPGTGYDELPDGVLVADGAGRVMVVNVAGAKLLHRPVDELVGLDYRAVLPLYDAAGRDWWQCTAPYDGLPTRTAQPERQLSLDGPDGRSLLVTARYVREGGRVVRLVVAFRDATARERLERSGADLISTVAHELRSPLTSVKGFTATLLSRWDRFPDETKLQMLRTVNADADRVTRLLTELLDVSRIDAGRIELRRQVVDLPRLVEKVFAGRVAAGDAAERLVLDRRSALPEMWADPDKLEQVLANLVENALKYGAGQVTVAVMGTSDAVTVTVTDEGEGIPDELLPMVFAKFWRRGGVTRVAGTGLGLYISKGLVEAHGGSITAGRGPAGGAEFRFVLPAGSAPYES